MKVKDNRKEKPTTIEQLNRGDCFEYDGSLYIYTTWCGEQRIVDLRTGLMSTVMETLEIKKIVAEVNIYDEE